MYVPEDGDGVGGVVEVRIKIIKIRGERSMISELCTKICLAPPGKYSKLTSYAVKPVKLTSLITSLNPRP